MNTTITVHVCTDKIGSTCEKEVCVDAEEWQDMSAAERDEFCRDIMFEMIEWGYEEKTGGT